MSQDDHDYFRRRAEQERKAAEEAQNPAAADAHKALAALYSSLSADTGAS